MWIYYPVINDIYISVDVDNTLGHVGYIEMGGTVIPSTSYQPSGGITMGGSADVISTLPAAGGAVLSGSATLSGTLTITGSGGMVLADTSQGVVCTSTFQPSGGMTLSGRALRSWGWHYGFWPTIGWWSRRLGWWGMPITKTRILISG